MSTPEMEGCPPARPLDRPRETRHTPAVSIPLDFDEQAPASLPLGPGEHERHTQIEPACRFYANGWL